MNSIIDYLRWRGDLPFSAVPPCAVDFLIFAQLVHAPLERLEGAVDGRPLCELTQTVYLAPPGKNEHMLIRSRYELWCEAMRGERFAGVMLSRFASHFNPEEEKQFAGALFMLNGGTGVVAFRGTDATLVGWKEDFNMSFESPVPSQQEAAAFLEAAAMQAPVLYACGHSKGGNLAMYSACMCSSRARTRIREVYSFDGPGLDAATLDSPGYREVGGRIHSFIPESSIIGLLMGYRGSQTIIESDSVSLLQHNPYYWHVLGAAFVTAPDTTASSRFTDKTLHDFLSGCTPGQRRVLVDTLYSVLSASGAQRLKELPRCAATHREDIAAALRAVPPEDYAVVSQTVKLLVGAGGENARLLLRGFMDRLGLGGGDKAEC